MSLQSPDTSSKQNGNEIWRESASRVFHEPLLFLHPIIGIYVLMYWTIITIGIKYHDHFDL